jgi:dienelactone hydrolase
MLLEQQLKDEITYLIAKLQESDSLTILKYYDSLTKLQDIGGYRTKVEKVGSIARSVLAQDASHAWANLAYDWAMFWDEKLTKYL